MAVDGSALYCYCLNDHILFLTIATFAVYGFWHDFVDKGVLNVLDGDFMKSSKSDICRFRALSPLHWINVKKLQFIHSVNGEGSKTAKIIKRQC